jgi:hypothetical protein
MVRREARPRHFGALMLCIEPTSSLPVLPIPFLHYRTHEAGPSQPPCPEAGLSVRALEILVASPPPPGVSGRGHAGRVINQ